jgi:pimeloyl-ACP methyl ester carboxylesterase
MLKKSRFTNNIDILYVYLHGYKGSVMELNFLRKYIVKTMKCSFFSFNYGDRDKDDAVIVSSRLTSELIDVIKRRVEYKYRYVFLIGYSLGGAIAVDCLAMGRYLFDGAILLSIFDNRKDMLKERNVEISHTENLVPANQIRNITQPVVFIHGKYDDSVSIDRAHRVYEKSNKESSLFLEIPTSHYFKLKPDQKSLCEAVNIAHSYLKCHCD